MVRSLNDIWRDGGGAIGAWLSLRDPFLAEVAATAGYDYVCIDMQHGLADLAQTVTMLHAMARTPAVPLVRVPWNETGIIGRVLDAGALGVIIPMVNTPDEARRAVDACRYAPAGTRSFGPLGAAVRHGADYALEANDAVACIPMIETRQAIESIDEILAVPGIDAAYVGPADLALTYGLPPAIDNPGEPFDGAARRRWSRPANGRASCPGSTPTPRWRRSAGPPASAWSPSPAMRPWRFTGCGPPSRRPVPPTSPSPIRSPTRRGRRRTPRRRRTCCAPLPPTRPPSVGGRRAPDGTATSVPTPALVAISPACSGAVCDAARWLRTASWFGRRLRRSVIRSTSITSWTRTSAPRARRTTLSHGPVSPENTTEPTGVSKRNPNAGNTGACCTSTALTWRLMLYANARSRCSTVARIPGVGSSAKASGRTASGGNVGIGSPAGEGP